MASLSGSSNIIQYPGSRLPIQAAKNRSKCVISLDSMTLCDTIDKPPNQQLYNWAPWLEDFVRGRFERPDRRHSQVSDGTYGKSVGFLLLWTCGGTLLQPVTFVATQSHKYKLPFKNGRMQKGDYGELWMLKKRTSMTFMIWNPSLTIEFSKTSAWPLVGCTSLLTCGTLDRCATSWNMNMFAPREYICCT